jgi:pimeloyl-ACP methyl ester carboxylesterase
VDLVFLHGFLSSPQSAKITGIPRYLREQGHSVASVSAIDLYPTKQDFEEMTLSKLIEKVITELEKLPPVVLIGSSHGALIAIWVSHRRPDLVQRLVLLAPALFYYRNLSGRYEVEAWRRQNHILFNYPRFGGETRLGYQYIQDLKTYENPPAVTLPTLIIHGTADQFVPLSDTDEYVRTKAGDLLTVHRLEGGNHRLSNVPELVNIRLSEWLGDPI